MFGDNLRIQENIQVSNEKLLRKDYEYFPLDTHSLDPQIYTRKSLVHLETSKKY